MRVRPAIRSDLPAIEALFEELDAFHRVRLPERFQDPGGRARTKEHLVELVEGADHTILLAENDETTLGFVTLEVRDTPPLPLFVPRRIGVIDSLGVRASARRGGVGRALVAAAETWLREHGASDVELSVYEANQEAVAFYEAVGYRLLSRRMSRHL